MNRARRILLTVLALSCLGALLPGATGCSRLTEPLDFVLLAGASGSELDRPTVVSFSPFTDARDIPRDATITIAFSRPMDEVETRDAIVITANGGNTSATFNWISNQLLVISFPDSLSAGKRYQVQILQSGAKDQDGNTLVSNYVTHFYTVGASGVPFVVSSNPPVNSGLTTGWPVNQNPVITFSAPMDQALTNPAITVSGGAAVFVKAWNADSTQVTLDLLSNLTASTTYKLSIGTGAASLAGLSLDQSYEALFFTGATANSPDVAVTSTPSFPAWPATLTAAPTINTVTGVSKNDSIQFTFTEDMDQSATISAISFNPALTGQFNWSSARILTFTPTTALTQDTQYRLSIGTGATSAAGLPLANNYLVDFTVNNANDSTAIVLAGVDGITPPATADITVNTAAENSITTGGGGNYFFDFRLTTAGAAALKTSGTGDLFSQISIEYVSGGPSTATPSIQNIDYTPGANPQTIRVELDGFNTNVRYRKTAALLIKPT